MINKTPKSKKITGTFLSLIVVITLLICLQLFFSSCSCTNSTIDIGNVQETKTTKIVDGDTIYVEGLKERVRVIGVNCPEINTTAGKESKNYTESLIKKGTTIWLESDKGDLDKYGRPLRYIWLEKPPKQVSYDDVKNKTLNGKLLTNNKAEIMTIAPNTKYSNWFEKMK